jgi:hypothetical protein
MNLIEFPEQSAVIAKDQPQYRPMPCFINPEDEEGRLICCWKLTLRERLRVLFTGKIWHHILTFRQRLQPQLLSVRSPFDGK